MKYSIIILLSILVFSCTTQTKKQNVLIAEQYVRAVESLDYNKMELLLADDYQGFGPSVGHSIGKQEAIENWKQNSENLYQKVEFTLSEFVAVVIRDGENKGDWVSNWGLIKIQYKNGKGEVNIWANSNYKIENGKIVRSYSFYNEADALRQLGYVFINPNDL